MYMVIDVWNTTQNSKGRRSKQKNFVRTKGCDWSIKLIYKDRDSSIVRKQLILVLVSVIMLEHN